MQSSSNNDDKETIWWQPNMVLFGRLSGWISGPIIIALFLGKWLDEKYNSEPWLFLTTVGAAFIISSIGIVKETTKSIKSMEQQGRKIRAKNKKSKFL
ncbi:MAG: AtpZ/AtpI family protein [Patescibacteria group bacterium]|nr:AtpZ/AtpI family protein [Patescibacteria group bacterium]